MNKFSAAFLVLSLAALSLSAEEDRAGNGYNKEQMLLFGTHHLDNVNCRVVLKYDFKQQGSHTRELNDLVALEISDIAEDGSKNLKVEFLSGKDRRPFADIEGFRSNPLVMYFLQWDVEKMGSGGTVTHHYFRHLLRQAFLTDVSSKEITVTHGGKPVKATRILLSPLGDDKEGVRKYRNYVRKTYEFVLADAVPGRIYRIATLVPGAEPGDGVMERTEMKFSRMEPSSCS